MALNPDLLAIVVCPDDRGRLLDIGGEVLYNPRLRRAYPVRDGVPILLADAARTVDEREHQELVAAAN